MSSKRKFNRKSKYTLSQKIISAVTAAGFIMQPVVGFATSIHKADDAFKDTIVNNGNVTHIWADRVVDNAAINVFKDFNLSANDIANMYFNTKNPTGADKANLVNFVNSRIDINGTVNAIQNSQIGGNLFFLSKDGMAVGKSGVINTGSLYVMTPTPDFMEAVQTVGTEAPAKDANKYLGYITNITDPTKANAWEIIPVNTSGTITVLGKVNATNEVQMRAAKIGVGKNVDDQVVDEVASGDTVSAASITTGVTNFGDLVNIKGVDGAEDVKSGLTGELTATQTGSGDIVLSAYVDGATEKNNLEELPFIGGTFGPIAETAENTFVEQDFNASVDVYGTVATGVETTEKKGNININATAVNSNADFNEQINDYELNDNDVAQLANVKAEVNIGGTVNAAEDVTVKAEAINRYIDNSGAVAKAVSVGVSSGTPITGDVAYSVLNTEANVNITSDGSIKSGKGVDIDAKAETLAASAASVTALKFKAAGGTTGANVPAVSVLYTNAVNKANVTVEGNINAAENISIDADADMKVDAENKMGIKGKMGNQFVVGVTVAGAENSASVDIKDEDNSNNVINAGNDLSVNANATSDFTSGTSIKAPEASAMAVAVNVTDFNSNANVNIDTDLTAGNDLTVKADNIITDDNVIAESTIGSGKYVSAATQVVTGHVEQKKGEVKDFISGLAAKLGKDKKLPIGDDDDIPGLQLSEIFKAGATVTYSGQKHDSSVTIGKNASLKANAGKLDIGALTKIEDAHITATGTTSSYNDAYPAELTVNAAVLVNNMDNSSSVVVADRDEGSAEPTLKGKNGVSVNASTRFEYNRIKNMIQDVKDAANQIASAVGGLKGSIKNDFNGFIDTLNKQIDAWESAFKTADETLATSDKGVLAIGEAATAGYNVLTALNNLNTMLDNRGSEVAAGTKAAIQGASDLLTSALAFADPNSYGNFAASSASKGSSGDTGSIAGHHSSAVNGAGTVMVNTVNSVSKVEIGSNAVINAVGKVELNAENYMKDVSLGGLNAVPLTNSGGGTAASIGATVNYSDFNTDTVVAVNDGAEISGGDINIAGSNEIDHVSVAGSAGMGPSDETESKGIVLNGMLSFVDGSSDILTVVDDGAELTANAQKQYTETVKDEETGEETEVTKTSEGNISISGHNDTNIVNVAAGLNLGSGSGAVGVGLAYNDFAVKNIAGVADVSEQINALYTTKEHYTDDNGEDAVRYVVDEDKVKELNDKLSNNYTASKADNGSISGDGFNVDAATEGSIQSVSVAGSASKNDDTGETSFFGKIKGSISNTENKLLGTGGKLDTVTGKIFGTESGKANNFFNMGSKTHGANGDGIKINNESSGKGGFMPSFSIAGSGSVSMNMLDNATQAIVDNAKITIMNNNGDINVTARDVSYAGAYSGAAALQWKSGGSASDKSVGFSGAAGVNDITNKVNAAIKNSIIKNADEVNTMALSGGEQLALGLGLNVAKSGNTSGYSGNAAVSVNLIDHDVEALHENNTVQDTGDINVAAYARDIENTGGGSLSAGQQKVGIGASVGVAMLNNNISAGIRGGSYTNVGSIEVDALNALKNVTVGVAAGLSVASGSGTGATVEGAGVYNEVHNTTNAFIEGSNNNNVTIGGGSVNVVAQDVAIDASLLNEVNDNEGSETKIADYEQALNELADGEAEIKNRMGKDFDITGKNELDGINMSDAVTQTGGNIDIDKDGGSSIITVAAGLAATNDKGAGGAAVAITDIENTYTAKIVYADITAETVSADAGSNSNIVTVAGGIAAASKGSGVGSVSWNDVVNTANVDIRNSTVNAQSTTAKANNTAQIVSVGGQISGAGKAAVGATLSYVGLDNSTEVNIKNTAFEKRDEVEADDTSVTAEATNQSDSYNIGAGVSAGGSASVSGTVVVTQTHGTAGAVMDKVTINNAEAVTAKALDDTDILSVIGSINASGKVAAGAGVAYTEIGDVSTDTENGQHVTAEIKNSTINSADAGSTVSANAEDTARVYNIAIGVGGAGNVAVQGASATTLINKETSAGINRTNIDAGHEGSTKANVTVDAQNSSEITSSADVAAAAGSGAGVGAGIAVNRIIQQTNATVNGGKMNVNNLTVNANATPRIENIGVGVGVAGTGAGVTGSVAVNMIENNVIAHIGGGANIVANDNVGVVATSDEQIANYVGSASVAGTGAAVGASVSVNKITGTTSATVGDENTDTKVTAKGNGSDLTTNTAINKDTINKALIDNETVDIDSHIARGEESRKGLVVDASSTRDMKSFLINASVAGEGAGVTGTVNVNMIDGATEAGITDTVVNGESNAAAAQNANVFINAGDYTNSSGFVGGASVAGIGGGVGLASDTNTVERTTSAIIEDSNINAKKFEVDADSMQGVSSFTVSAGVAGIGAGVSGVVSVTDLKNTTQAAFLNSKVTAADTVDIKATHKSIINAGNVGVGAAGLGAGVGLSVGVLKDNSETRVDVGDNEKTADVVEESEINAENNVNVAATNTAVVKPVISATGAGAAGAAGATSINNINSVVKTNINHADINSKQGSITGNAQNTFDIDAYMGGNAAGAFGSVGVSVTVNTIDSTVQTNVTDSELTAESGNITLTANETRDIEQIATNVSGSIGVSAGANIAITNVGEKVENDENSNAADKIAEANNMYSNDEDNSIVSLMGGASDALTTAGINDAVPTIGAGYGGENKDSQITVNITDSNIGAGNTITAKATESDNISMTLGSGVAGAAAVNAGVGILNVHRNVGVNINGGQIDAKTVDIDTDITGKANLNVYQGSAGVVGANAAVGQVNTTGSSSITVNDVDFTADEIDILAADHGISKVNTLGITVGAVSVGAIVAMAENTGNTSVAITNSSATAKDDADENSITISTEKANTVDAHATGGTGGVVSGNGVVATASDSGTSSITVGAADGGENTFKLNNINIAASAKPFVKAVADSVSVGFLGTAGASVATATATGGASVNVQNSNEFIADTVNIDAKIATQDGKNTVEALVEGNSGGGYASVSANAATATAEMDVSIDVGDVDYKTETTNVTTGYEYDEAGNKTPIVEDVTNGATALNITASNTAKNFADARGVTIGGLFSSGNNVAKTENISTTTVNFSGSKDDNATLLDSLNIAATGTADNKATADGSGGGIVGADLAAMADNNINSTTSVTIGGKLNVDGDIEIEALQSDTANINADALKATVVGLSATEAENTIIGSTTVKFDDAEITGSGKLDANAANSINFGNTEKYAVEGSGYGGINVQGAVFNNDITKNAAIDVVDSDILTAGAQTMEAKTTGNINASGYIKAAGLGAFTWADINNNITTNNNVNVDAGSSLETAEEGADITLAAVDNMDLTVSGVADVQGAAVGGASSDVQSTLTRNNKITVGGDLYAMNDVNLYAGRDKNGSDGILDLAAESETYNYAALPIANPKLDDKIYQNNQVVVNSDSDISSVRNINLFADAGKENVRDTTLMYTWVYSDKQENYTSSTVGDKENNNKDGSNYVQVDGKLTAGVQNKQYITIGGTYDPETGKTEGSQLVFLNTDTLEAVQDYGNGQEGAVGADKIIINVSDNIDKNSIEFGTFDYGLELFERYNQLGELMQSYAEKKDGKNSTAYLGYQAEQQRVLEQLKAMGLVEEFVGPDNEKYYGAVEGMKVDYIELPDIIASGGNINIQTDALMSNGGELTAQGAPEVVINNNTNLYLKVNNVTVGEAGGEIIYNNVAITSDNNDEINKINTQNGKADKIAAFDSIEADAGDNNVGKLIINGNYDGDEIKAIVKGDFDGDGIEESQEIQTVPRADIEINGVVNSNNGIVEITSANNSIIIQGEDASSSAGVTGKEVHLTASNGSVSQGFHDGITNIGGSVQDLYKDQYESIKDSLDEEYKLDNTNNIHKVVYGDEKEASGNMISGENIYISASDININGSMQSGYADYILDIDASVQDKITEIQQNWQNNGSEVLSDAIITTGDTYKIVVGKNELQSDGSYVRYIDAYYNPYTGKIVVPDVDAKGGKIYLTGRISSTGSGSIKVLDGAYDIKVTNNTGTDLQLGKLVSNNADGLISITDTAKNTITELTRDKTVVKAWNEDANDWNITQESGASNEYNPQEGLRYNWTTGQEVSTTKTYEHTIKAGLWGAVETVNKTDLTDLEQTLTPVESSDDTHKDKLNGEYIGSVSDIDNSKDFAVIYDNTVMQNSQNGPGEPERWSTGFLGWFKWEKYTWSRTTGTSQQYVASVKADKPISIGFIGNADGNSNIDITSAGNINLTNNIASASAGTDSVINISTGGAINQLGGSIIGDNININAASGINNIGITSMGDNVSLNAVNNGSGNVDITVNAAYGTKGNVVLGKLSTTSGTASLTADGSITQTGTDASVIADRIDLVSNNGAIGTYGQALVVQGGQTVTDATNSLSASVNAQAEGNIYLTQADGDLRIGRVYSDNGDVAVTVIDGDLIDALPAGEVVDRGNTDELIQKWTDLGLIEGEGAFADKIQQDIDDYKASISEEYNLYNDMKSYYDEIDNQDKGDPNYLAFEKLQEKYNGYNSAEEYLEKNNEAKNKIAELSQEDKKYWNKDQLLYAISDAIINPDSGATDNIVKDPNIKGNNITVTVNGGSAGLNSNNTKVIGYEDMTNVESLKQLASADASNVTYKDGKFTITEKLPVGIQSTGGITVVTDGNAYLTGRTENDTDNVLNINEITATGDIRLQGQHGIYNMNAGDRAAITGNNLLIQAGEGSIGSADKMMTIDIDGTLQAQSAENIYINQTGANDLVLASVGAGKDIVLQAVNNIVNSSDTALAGADSYIRSDDGTISLIAGGNIGQEGNGIRILDNGAVVNADAKQNIYLSGVSGDGSTRELVLGTIKGANLDVTSVSDISLGRDNSVKTEENETVNSNINVGSGNVTLTTNSGSITQTAGSIIKANSVKATATQNVLLASNTNQVNNFVVNGYGNDNSLTGNVDLASTVNNDVNVEFGKIVDGEKVGLTVNNGSVNVNSLGNMSNLNITGGSLTTTGENSGRVTFTSAGSITANTTIDSAADIVMDANGAITTTGSLTAGNLVDVTTTNGAINVGGTVTAKNDSVNITSGSGNITTTGTISGGNDVKVDTVSGDITAGGDVTGKNNVTIHSGVGTINVSGDVTATEKDVDITSGSGAITTTGAITGGTDVNVTTESGAINIGGEAGKGNVTANNNINIDTNAGDITLNGKVNSINGFTHIAAGTYDDTGVTTDDKGDVTVNGEIASGDEVIVNAVNGSITVNGTTNANNGNVETTVNGDGNINLNGTVSASGDVTATVTGEGDIITGNKASVSGTDIIFTTNDGDITTGSDLTAYKNIDLNVNTGNITFGGDVTAKDGNITIDITGDGSLKDAENANNTLIAKGQEGSADSGNIIINLKGAGDVDLHDLYATNNARLDIANGNLTLHEINGELVAMQLRTEGREMDVDKITAGTQIVLTGSDMSLDNIAQRPDADGMLVVTPDGAQADKPIDNFTIGNIQTNAGSGIRFDRLWVNNSDIHISEGQLWFDKLYVENMAHFSNSNMVAGIYGVPPVRDGSDSVYWINTSENRPDSDLQAWQAGAGDWMYLRFTDDAIQESNGILLTLDEYDYVYDQRFTAEDHLRYQHGRYLDEDYKQAYGYGVSLHNRYGLIDYQDFTEENAGEDEIAVEA